MSTFGELLEDVQQQMLGKLKDIVANETEHSLVDGDVRRKIATLLEEEMNAANAQVVENDPVSTGRARTDAPRTRGHRR